MATHLRPLGKSFSFDQVVFDLWRLQKVSFLIHFVLLD